jgi:TonB family protein
MFLNFYNLREQPFGVTPDPRFLCLTKTHREALASLWYGVNTDRGFLTLVAKPGMGKTSLLFRLLEHLGNSAHTAFLFQTQCTSRELFRYLLTDLGVPDAGDDLVQMHTRLNEILVQNAQAGKRTMLVIDEAQNLDPEVLETVRLLSDFETPKSKLMQIILAGQPQFAEKLALPSLTQLNQRVSIFSQLTPLDGAETQQYIDHRLHVAGYAGGRLFTPEAMNLIAEASQGTPRDINNICFNALSLGCASKCKPIDEGVVREVISDMKVNSFAPTAPVETAAQVQPVQVQPVQVQPVHVEIPPPVRPATVTPVAAHGPTAKVTSPWLGRAATSAVVVSLASLSFLLIGRSHANAVAEDRGLASSALTATAADPNVGMAPPVPIALTQPALSALADGTPALRSTTSASRSVTATPAIPTGSPSLRRPAPETRPGGELATPTATTHNAAIRKAESLPPDLPSGVSGGSLPLSNQAGAALGGLIGGTQNPALPAPNDASRRILVGGNVQQGRLIRMVRPVYPAIAAASQVEGTITLKAVISKDGQVKELRYVSGPSLLSNAALDAVRQWHYQPTLLDGNPVEVETTILLVFKR